MSDLHSFQATRYQQITDRLKRAEAPFLYAQLGMPASKIADRVGMSASKVCALLRHREEDVEAAAKLANFLARHVHAWVPAQ